MSSDSFLDKYGKPFIIGSLSGSVASAVIQPIDTTKVVIQNKREHAGKTKINLNPFHIAKEIIKENGVAGTSFVINVGLYKGVDSAIMRQFIYCGMRLGIYKALEDRIRHKENRNLSFGEKIQYSLFSGAIGSVIANPTDVALIRFQSDNSLPQAERRNYKNVVDALVRIGKEEGIKGLWTGAVPTVTRAMAVNSSQLVSYNEAKE